LLLVWIKRFKRAGLLVDVAVQVAADVPDDAEAVVAVKAAGGRPKAYELAAEMARRDRYRYERRNGRRAARLLAAAADGGPPVRVSSEEEALFRAVDNIEALPVEDAFTVLAAEVPALRELEHRVIASRSAPGWEDRDADDRVREILGNLDRLVGPQAPAGSLFIRSAAARDRARVHLLGTAGLLREDPEPADPEEQAAMLAALARGYGVKPEVKEVARAIRKRVGDRDGFPTKVVLFYLLGEPGMGERLRRGDGPSDSSRKAMTELLANNRYPSPAEFVDRVVEEMRSTLLQTSGPAEEVLPENYRQVPAGGHLVTRQI
jgi:hypothetical protein